MEMLTVRELKKKKKKKKKPIYSFVWRSRQNDIKVLKMVTALSHGTMGKRINVLVKSLWVQYLGKSSAEGTVTL